MNGYRFQGFGDCLGGLAPSGTWFEVEPTKEIRIGDLVAVVLKSEGTFSGLARSLCDRNVLGVAKVFLGMDETPDGSPVYVVGQLNPPLVVALPVDALDALHAVAGMSAEHVAPEDLAQPDRLSFDLLMPFCRETEPLAPINAAWTPSPVAGDGLPMFSCGFLETAVGPGIGSMADLVELVAKARDASISADEEVKLADGLNFALQNTPFINLFYTRPALDYLFLNSMREAASPGYMKRVQGRRKKDYGQTSFMPPHLRTFGR